MKRFSLTLLIGCLAVVILGAHGDINDTSGRIGAVVPKVSELKRFESPAVNVRGIDWKLVIERRVDVIDVFLYASHEIIRGEPNAMRNNDSFDVDATFELLTYDPSAPLKKSFNPQEYWPSYFYWGYGSKKGCKSFITWNAFVDDSNKFVEDNTATFVVEFSVGERIHILDRSNVPCM